MIGAERWHTSRGRQGLPHLPQSLVRLRPVSQRRRWERTPFGDVA